MSEYRHRRNALIKALRSGLYKQGQVRLQSDGAFCCLGVACEVAIKNGIEIKKEEIAEKDEKWRSVSYDGSLTFMPMSVAGWYGFSDCCGGYYDRNNRRKISLMFLNDIGKSFEEIADVIESNPKGLFKD